MFLSKSSNALVSRDYVEFAYQTECSKKACTFEEWLLSDDCRFIELTEEEEANFRKKHQYKRQNNYIKDRYDRFSFVLPKGYKEKLKKYCQLDGSSLQDFIAESLYMRMKMMDEMYNMPKE